MIPRTIGLLILGALLVGCSPQGLTADGTDPAAASFSAEPTLAGPSATPDPSPTVSPSAAASPTPVQDQVLDVAWAVDFTMTVPGDWTSVVPTFRPFKTTGTTFWMYTPNDRRFAITTSGPETVDEWVQEIISKERMMVTEPQPVEVGGAPGYSLDITPTGEGCAERFGARACGNVFGDSSGYWPIQENRPTRAWVLDVDGETLLIVTDAPQGGFEEWVEVVGQALATLEWRQ